jgi:hypothetical protein
MRRKLVAALMAGVSVFAFAVQASASDKSNWIPGPHFEPSYHSMVYQDLSTLKWNYSVMQSGEPGGMFLCSSSTDEHCKSTSWITYSSVLRACNSPGDTNCIESLQATDSTGNVSSATFENYTVTNHVNSYPADPKLGIPAGDVPSIWNLEGAKHGTSTQYAIVAGISGDIRNGQSSNNVLALSLFPVSLRDFGATNSSLWNYPQKYDFCRQIQQSASTMNINCGHVLGPDCLLPTNASGMCYQQEDFPSGSRFSVKLRLAKEPTAWLHGRMVDPDIEISPLSSGGITLSVTAATTNVPMVYQGALWADLPQSVKNFWVACMNGGSDSCGMIGTQAHDMDYWKKALTLDGNTTTNLEGSVNSFGSIALQGMKAIAPLVGDKANAQTSSWSYRTLSNSEMSGANACFTKSSGVKGLVTTNSTTYSAGPPTFDKSTGILNYQVASPHFNPDGTVFKGNYNLVIKSDVARCLYGFSKAPVNATISITSADGTPQLATTVVGEKDGWIYLKASNFEFSAPTVQVKLTQDAPATSTQSTAAKKKSMSITCIKGKASKLVTGSVCPSGYKKK